MLQNLFYVPIYVIVALMSALVATTLAGPRKIPLLAVIGVIAGVAAGAFAYSQPWGRTAWPVRGYGVMILIGFLLGVYIAARRAPLIGAQPKHVLDMSIFGVLFGLLGARIFHVLMHWDDFNPFTAEGFAFSRIVDMFRIWEGGLVFFGTFITVIPWAWLYSRWHKLPKVPFLDICAPGLILGLAFGRIGCFLNGCCYGKLCDLPWAVHFPPSSPVWHWQTNEHLLARGATQALGVHPTQIYASIAAFLTSAFLYFFWPRRSYDGQVISLMLIMAGTTRFFEEMLRTDEPAAFPALNMWMTIAQWFAIVIVASGFAMLLYFRQRPGSGAKGQGPLPAAA